MVQLTTLFFNNGNAEHNWEVEESSLSFLLVILLTVSSEASGD